MKSTVHDATALGRELERKRQRLIEILCETSFNYSAEPCFPLASGGLSKYYIDCKNALSDPEARELIGELIIEKTRNLAFDSVAGLELGAVPIAMAVSDVAYRKYNSKIQALIIRKQPKPHGLRKHIEGRVTGAEHVLVVDDVITTGQSTISAIEKISGASLEVIGVVAIIDRQESHGRENIEALGVRFDALVTLEELENSAQRRTSTNH
jgi:orotate phosphoribosyltransferase